MQPNKSSFKGFREKFLGLICLALFFIVFIVVGSKSNTQGLNAFSEVGGLGEWVMALLPFVAFMIVARAGGLDFSILPLAGLSTIIAVHMLDNGKEGIIIALIVAAVIGLIHGILINYLKWPSTLVTIGSGILMVMYSSINYPMDNFEISMTDTGKTFLIGLGIALAIAAFVLNLVTPLGKPMKKRNGVNGAARISYTLAYVLSALIACVLGFIVMSTYGQAQMIQQTVEIRYIVVLLMVGCTTLFDNRFLAIIATVLISGLYTLTGTQAMSGWIDPSIIVALNAAIIIGALLIDVVYKRNYNPAFMKYHDDVKANEIEEPEIIKSSQDATNEVKQATVKFKETVDELTKTVEDANIEMQAAKTKVENLEVSDSKDANDKSE